MKAKEGEPAEEEHEKQMHFLGPPRDWIERFGRHFMITEHTHLQGNNEREILPWLKLASELDPQKIETYTVAAYWLRDMGKIKEAEGFLREGLSVCKAIRDRHDGVKRNPWNEFECGSHYARSMANYAYVTGLTGFQYSAVEQSLSVAPVIFADNFRCFFSVEGAWGMVERRNTEDGIRKTAVEVMEGELKLRSFCGMEFRETRTVKAGERVEVEG